MFTPLETIAPTTPTASPECATPLAKEWESEALALLLPLNATLDCIAK